jgi:hypothetical protein
MSLCLVISIAAAKGLVNSRPNREEEEEKEAQDKERKKYGNIIAPTSLMIYEPNLQFGII